MHKKFAKESYTEMNELVLPNDTNTFGNLMGGRLLYWMDICSAMASQKHSNSPVVTVSVDTDDADKINYEALKAIIELEVKVIDNSMKQGKMDFIWTN